VAGAVEAVEGACAADIANFCSNVTRGEGRVLLCMQAHEDQLSRRCQFALYRASRGLDRAISRVERIADACLSDIETQCGEAERIGQCLVQKSGSLSQSCQTTLALLRQAVQGLVTLRGMPVYSADDKNIGQVAEVTRGPDGKVVSVQIAVGRWLGIGDRVVTISADDFERMADRIRLRLAGDEVRAMPEAKTK
jgi:predicted ABC-type transport system involved in lysophospholipase L1 biosynthesis ATPase subunit